MNSIMSNIQHFKVAWIFDNVIIEAMDQGYWINYQEFWGIDHYRISQKHLIQ